MKKRRVNMLLLEDSRHHDFTLATEEEAAYQAACRGHMDIMKYFVEERKISEKAKFDCVYNAAWYGQLSSWSTSFSYH